MTTAVLEEGTTEKKGTYISAHCGNGVHENVKKLSPGGALLTSCRGIYAYSTVTITCWCWCHELYRQFAPEVAAALPVPSIHPTPATSGGNGLHVPSQHVPSDDDGSWATSPSRKEFYTKILANGDLRNQLEGQVLRFIHTLVLGESDPKIFSKPGPGGRRPRGTLDLNVEIICRLHIEMYLPGNQLTPQDIANFINALDPPSQGAINAVLSRWQDAGYCRVEKNPARFGGFIGDAAQFGIAHMKKRTAASARARSRGFF